MGGEKLAFVGVGMIGAGLAVNAMLNGYEVALYDIQEVTGNITACLDALVDAQVCTREEADAAFARGTYTDNLAQAVTGAVFVQECVAERLELKQEMYRKIQEITGDRAVIASSTSMLLPTKLQEGALYPECIVVGHPYNPSYLLPLIEVCGGEQTSPDAVRRAVEIYTGMGKKPIVCRKEVFGLIVNMVSWAALDAAKKAILDGVCTVEEMDQALMYGPGLRMAVTGQILTISLGVKGGMRAMGGKYGEVHQEDLILADGLDEELAHRPEELGRDNDSVARFRDRMIADILRGQGLLKQKEKEN